jgi:hypothetical protein
MDFLLGFLSFLFSPVTDYGVIGFPPTLMVVVSFSGLGLLGGLDTLIRSPDRLVTIILTSALALISALVWLMGIHPRVGPALFVLGIMTFLVALGIRIVYILYLRHHQKTAFDTRRRRARSLG